MYINWVGRAEAAEAAGDWAEAKKCWYYAAQQYRDNGNLASEFHRREDAAEVKRRAALVGGA